MQTLEKNKTSILEKYSQEDLQALFIHFIKFIEQEEKKEEDDEVESPVLLHRVDFEDLPKEVQNDFLEYEKNKDTIKLYNI